jgi:hypothetical protein
MLPEKWVQALSRGDANLQFLQEKEGDQGELSIQRILRLGHTESICHKKLPFQAGLKDRNASIEHDSAVYGQVLPEGIPVLFCKQ